MIFDRREDRIGSNARFFGVVIFRVAFGIGRSLLKVRLAVEGQISAAGRLGLSIVAASPLGRHIQLSL